MFFIYIPVFFILFLIYLISKKEYYLALTVFSINMAIFGYIFNMGWLRFILLIYGVAIIHPIIFFFTNKYSSKFIHKSKLLKIIYILFNISFFIPYIILPDFADTGGAYSVFGLIHNNYLTYILQFVACILAFLHIILFFTQIILTIEAKKI